MTPPSSLRSLAILAAAIVCLPPVAGCGSGAKKGGLTIAQRLDKARSEKTPEAQARELTKVARLQWKKQDRTGATKTLDEAKQLIPDDGDPAICGPRCVEIAALYAEIGEKPAARKEIARAIAAAEKLEDPVAQATLLADAAAVQGSKTAGLGDTSAARGTIREAVKAADKVDARFRAKALAAVATGCLAAGIEDEAGKLVKALEESARSLEELRPKVEALVTAATVHARRGAKDTAKEILDEATAAAKAIDGHENRAYALVTVAVAMNATGDRPGATAILAEAEKSAGKVGDDDARKNATEKVRAAQAAIEKK